MFSQHSLVPLHLQSYPPSLYYIMPHPTASLGILTYTKGLTQSLHDNVLYAFNKHQPLYTLAATPLPNLLFFVHNVKVKVSVAQLCPALWNPWAVACQSSPSMGFPRQEHWSGFAMPSSRGSSRPRDRTQVSHIAGRFFTV